MMDHVELCTHIMKQGTKAVFIASPAGERREVIWLSNYKCAAADF